MTPVHKIMRREVLIYEKSCALSSDPNELHLTEQGKRNGLSLRWAELVNGDACLAAALQASVNA